MKYSLAKVSLMALILIQNIASAQVQMTKDFMTQEEFMNMNPGEAPGEEWVASEDFMKCAACLASKGRVRDSGRKAGELSAWLVKGDGGISCVWWPGNTVDLWNTGAQSITKSLDLSKYPVPRSTVGIIHSHPRNSIVVPAEGDQVIAARLRIPNFVVSGDGIWSYSPRTSRNFQHADYTKISQSFDKDYCKTIPVAQSATDIAKGNRSSESVKLAGKTGQ